VADLKRSAKLRMAKPQYTLAFASDQKGQVMMHADAKGLDVLIASLERLKKKVEAGECDHDHLMTDAWAGSELSERLGCESHGELVHHLKLYGWTEEWARKHGFVE
jgi:hypothetical protein